MNSATIATIQIASITRNADGLPHNIDGPTVTYPTGRKEWHINGQYHREDGPAITEISGYSQWYYNGKQHRVDGPAVIYSGANDRHWYSAGKYIFNTTGQNDT